MSISTEKEETDMLITAYKAARNKYIELGKLTDIAPYNLINTRNPIPFSWAIHDQMLNEHARELANELNQFGHQYRQLLSWAHILAKYEAADQLMIVREFVAAIATSCVSYPHVLKARFIYSISHLSHQHLLIINPTWEENNLPSDREINARTMNKLLKYYERYKECIDFQTTFNELCDKSYTSKTRDFRDKYHHRYPPRFELGITQTITRIKNEGRIQYGLGGTEPLKLIELAPLIIEQHEKALLCFYAYSSLVNRQLAEIYALSDKTL